MKVASIPGLVYPPRSCVGKKGISFSCCANVRPRNREPTTIAEEGFPKRKPSWKAPLTPTMRIWVLEETSGIPELRGYTENKREKQHSLQGKYHHMDAGEGGGPLGIHKGTLLRVHVKQMPRRQKCQLVVPSIKKKTLPTFFPVFFPLPSEPETEQSNRGKRGKNSKPRTGMLGENV